MAKLLLQRKEILRKIRSIDQRIKTTETYREHPAPIQRNPKPFCNVVAEILYSHPDGLTAAELEPAILATGYKTNSRDLLKLLTGSFCNCAEVFFDHKVKRCRLKAPR